MGAETEPPVAGTIDSLCKVKREYVDRTFDWYRSRSTWPRLMFRISGVTVIVLSLGIPFLSAAGDGYLKLGVPVASYVIALLSALSSFFGWQTLWEKRINTQLILEGRIAAWEAEIDAARRMPADAGYDLALRATKALIRSTKILTVGETATFFSKLKFPALPETAGGRGAPPNNQMQQPGAA
jgi:hypothetical protein